MNTHEYTEELAAILRRLEKTLINKESQYITGYRDAISEVRILIMELIQKEFGTPSGENFYHASKLRK